MTSSLKPSFYDEQDLRRLFPNASAAFIAANLQRLPSGAGLQGAKPKPNPPRKRDAALPKGKEGSAGGLKTRLVITSYRVRLIDEDNAFVKPLVDALRYANLIEDDCPGLTIIRWRQVKVATRAEERTVVEIEYPPGQGNRQADPSLSGHASG